MKISTKGRYAVRLMYDLAVHHTGDWVALKDVSRRQGISVKYLEQIVRQLSICGYLKSLRGPHGGYQLAKEPADYTIYEILQITEGSLQPVACLDDEINQAQTGLIRFRFISIWENSCPCNGETIGLKVHFRKQFDIFLETFIVVDGFVARIEGSFLKNRSDGL